MPIAYHAGHLTNVVLAFDSGRPLCPDGDQELPGLKDEVHRWTLMRLWLPAKVSDLEAGSRRAPGRGPTVVL